MESAMEILTTNHGFDRPEKWVDYAKANGFRRVAATPIPQCPDCSADPDKTLGQYIYYSTLVRLKTCGNCELIWADAAIDPSVLNAHFEAAYKDEGYFEAARADIFTHLAKVISNAAPMGGSVLDVGGGMGHLMHTLREMRMDLQVVVQDVSERSCEYAKDKFSLQTICGPMSELKPSHQYDVVVFSDSLYYESELGAVWNLLSRIVKPKGSVIIRGPNKLHWIRLRQALRRMLSSLATQDKVKHFNPEHKYVFSKRYLTNRLGRGGFESKHIPSPALLPRSMLGRMVSRSSYVYALLMRKLFGAVVSPSMVTVARRI